jgi:hypothetical protein
VSLGASYSGVFIAGPPDLSGNGVGVVRVFAAPVLVLTVLLVAFVENHLGSDFFGGATLPARRGDLQSAYAFDPP